MQEVSQDGDEINQTDMEEETRDAFVISSLANDLKFSGFKNTVEFQLRSCFHWLI